MARSENSLTPEDLVCGLRISLLALGTTKSKWTTVLIGALPGQYLIIEMPKIAGGPVKLDQGTIWTVTFVNRGQVYTFKSEILGHTYRLEPLLFLSYPADVEVASLRQEKRYPVNIPVLLEFLAPAEAETAAEEPEKIVLQALAVDISADGLRVASTQAVPENALASTTLFLPNEEPLEGLMAEVRSCRRRLKVFSLGLALLPGSSAAAARYVEVIKAIENTPLRL